MSAGTAPTTISVASVPAGHAYVRHLDPLDGPDLDAVVRLADPDPDHPEQPAGQRWWPPVMLDPRWVESHDVDVFHLHFGYDDLSPARLREIVAALRRRGCPLVMTLHDLRNPHHHDPARLDEQLAVLVPAADALVTLTDGAADVVAARWGRRPQVIAHPHVVDLATAARLREQRRGRPGFRIGVACKSLRLNTDPLRVLPTLLSAVQDLPDARLDVSIHDDLHADPVGEPAQALVTWLDDAAAAGLIDLDVHPRLDDDALWRKLTSLDAAVLPYRFGTHSGWLEACRDLGTTVLAPSSGHYADQGAEVVYDADEHVVDTASLTRGVRRAHALVTAAAAAGAVGGIAPEQRRAQRAQVAAAHVDLYRSLVVAREVAS